MMCELRQVWSTKSESITYRVCTAQTAKSKHCGSECRGLTLYDATMWVRAYQWLLPWHIYDMLSVCQDPQKTYTALLVGRGSGVSEVEKDLTVG